MLQHCSTPALNPKVVSMLLNKSQDYREAYLEEGEGAHTL